MKITLKQALFLIDTAAGFAFDEGQVKVTTIQDLDSGLGDSDEFLRLDWDSGGSFGEVSAVFNRNDNMMVDLVGSSMFLVEPDGEVFQLSLLKPMDDAEELVFNMPPEIPDEWLYRSVDEVAECLDGISMDTYHDLWAAVEAAEHAGTAKPAGGDGSDGTFEEPVITSGEYGTDLAAAWPRLQEATRQDIVRAATAKRTKEEA